MSLPWKVALAAVLSVHGAALAPSSTQAAPLAIAAWQDLSKLIERYFDLEESGLLRGQASDLELPKRASAARVELEELRHALTRDVRADRLPLDGRVDHAVLGRLLMRALHDLTRRERLHEEMLAYVGTLETGRALRDWAVSNEADLSKLAELCSDLERLSDQAVREPHLDVLRQAESFIRRVREAIEERSKAPAPGSNGNPSFDSGRRAAAALDARLAWLRENVAPAVSERERWGRPIGSEELSFLVREYHLIDASLDELEGFGLEHLRRIQAEMRETARTIDPAGTLESVLEEMSQDHPSAEGLPELAQAEMEAALALLLEKDLVTVPEPFRHATTVVTTGPTNLTYPFGGYGGASQQGDRYVGRYLVSPPLEEMSETEKRERLRGNNRYWTRVVAVHEVWPGHHLQGLVARTKVSQVRLRYGSTMFSEGWGLYSEQLMYEHGHFDAKTRLAQLKMQAWRAARVVIDIGLQSGGLSFDEAVALLVKEVGLEPENARAEVRRYLGTPTWPMSYFLGFRDILDLREEVRRVEGDAFNLRDFHDRLLAVGPIPLPLVRLALLGR